MNLYLQGIDIIGKPENLKVTSIFMSFVNKLLLTLDFTDMLDKRSYSFEGKMKIILLLASHAALGIVCMETKLYTL